MNWLELADPKDQKGGEAMKALHKAALIGVALALYSTAASAQLTNQGMLDQVVTEFATRARPGRPW
jgi:ABC-type dipeptide/oligopeptide/nickel transport system permease component